MAPFCKKQMGKKTIFTGNLGEKTVLALVVLILVVFSLLLTFFFCREILPCLKHVVKNGYSSLTMAALMRKISGKRNTLHLLQNPRGGPGEP